MNSTRQWSEEERKVEEETDRRSRQMRRDQLLGILSVLIAACVVPFSAYGAEESPKAAPQLVTIPNTAVHTLKGKNIDSVFRIDVSLPYGYEQTKQSYPVIYLTDGDMTFGFVTGNMRMLQAGVELPLAILVGIGYEVPNPLSVVYLRARDLTPTVDKGYEERQRASPLVPWPEEIHLGGAEKFLSFIDHELKPFIDSHYRTKPEGQTLIGYSLGGLFAFYVLMNHTDSFDRYVISSPSLYWDQDLCFKHEAAYSTSHKDLPKAVFMSFGSLEPRAGDMKRMVDRLNSRNYPNLRIGSHVFDDETHLSVVGASINRGLQFVMKESMVIEENAFRFRGKPSFSIVLPEGTSVAPIDSPNQVFAARTVDGVVLQAFVADIPSGETLEKAAERYANGLVSNGTGSDVKVTSNTEIVLKDGTKAYRSEVLWTYKPMDLDLKTQMVTAYKEGKAVSVRAHPSENPEQYVPMVESLRFE